MSATTPGVSPRLTALLSWRDSAAFPTSENRGASERSAARAGTAFVWMLGLAIPAEANHPLMARHAAKLTALCSLDLIVSCGLISFASNGMQFESLSVTHRA